MVMSRALMAKQITKPPQKKKFKKVRKVKLGRSKKRG